MRPTSSTPFPQRLAAFRKTADNWFDGTVDSVDRRVEKCSTLLATATAAVGNDRLDYIPTVAELTADRRALMAMREDLLNGASGREAGQTPLGRRLANEYDEGGEEDPDWTTCDICHKPLKIDEAAEAINPDLGQRGVLMVHPEWHRLPKGFHYAVRVNARGSIHDLWEEAKEPFEEGVAEGRREGPPPHVRGREILHDVVVPFTEGLGMGAAEGLREGGRRQAGEHSVNNILQEDDRVFRDPYSGKTDEGEFSHGHWQNPLPRSPHRHEAAERPWEGKPTEHEDHPDDEWATYPDARQHRARRWLTLEAARFARENIDAIHDAGELAERGRRYAATLRPDLAEHFAAEVASHARPRPRVASAPVFTEFPDSAMFL